MSLLKHLSKEQQEIMPLFDGAFIENKPIPFPKNHSTLAYSNLFYWAHLEAKETAEFPLHPHEGFEIMTFVFKGSLEHYDTVTNIWTALKEGSIQVIQSGSGVKHAERITKGTELFQIWFDPNFEVSLNKKAAYKDYTKENFIKDNKNGLQRLTYLNKDGVVYFETEGLEIQKLSMDKGKYLEKLDLNSIYSFYLLDGKVELNDTLVEKDDFFVIDKEKEIMINSSVKSELFIIKSPANIKYTRFIQRYIDR